MARPGRLGLPLLSRHVRRFLSGMGAMPSPGERVVVALSGGRDSALLLKVMADFARRGWVGGVRAVHLDHGTWGGAALRRSLRRFCREEGVGLDVVRRPLPPRAPNFEKRARDLRLEELGRHAGPRSWVALGHHLDDSLEWSLMRQASSCSARAALGIPLRRGRIVRPFLCLSRRQITALCRAAGVPWADDPSNRDERLERNWVRRRVAGPLRRRRPGLLRRHAAWQNALALAFGVHAWSRPGGPGRAVASRRIGDALLLTDGSGRNFLEAGEAVAAAVRALSRSPDGRGKVGLAAARIPGAMARGRRGPLSLSGGVRAHLRPGRLLLVPRGSDALERIDRAMAAALAAPPPAAAPARPGTPLGVLAGREPSPENAFAEYLVLDGFPPRHRRRLVKEAPPWLPSLGEALRRGGLAVVTRGRLRALCAGDREAAAFRAGCLYS